MDMEEYAREKRQFRKGLAWGFAIMLALSLLILLGIRSFGLPVVGGGSSDLLSTQTQEKLRRVTNIIKTNFYEEVDTQTLENGLFTGLLNSLGDPYSQYYTPEQFRALTTSTSGTYYGIGAVLNQNPETMEVIILRVYSGAPAEEAGLKAGDIILKVEDIDSTSMELADLIQHIKGEEGSRVHLEISREGEANPLQFDVERRQISVPTVEHQMLEGQIGFIQISEFSEVTQRQFREALDDLIGQGMKAFVVDVRDNPGGLLNSVNDILNDFMPEGLLVYTETRNGNKREYTSSGENFLDLPMVTLMNGNSASAAEIFAGAVQDHNYGTLIGSTSFGKGIVQQIIPLGDGSAIKLTIARYFTPNGDFIHDKGITPDIELPFEYLSPEDTTYNPMNDNQVLRAIEVLKEKMN